MSIALQMDFDSFHGFVEMLKDRRETFSLSMTGYTKCIKWKGETFNFINEAGNKVMFACHRMIKKDIEQSNIIIDSVPRFSINYFSINNYLKKRNAEMPSKVLNIDINSAYLQTLFNTGLIRKKTFDFVSTMDKLTRLKSVGMLATQKLLLEYEKGILQPVTKDSLTSDGIMRNFYFFVAYETGIVMRDLANILEKGFLFYWVDGIYTTPDVDPEQVKSFLKVRGYESKAKELNECSFESVKDCLYFRHRVEGSDKPKTFNIPFEDETNRKRLNRYIQSLITKQQSHEHYPAYGQTHVTIKDGIQEPYNGVVSL